MNKRTNSISGNTYDEERALYNLCDAEVTECRFAGPTDGESAFKEARNITVKNCEFSLRYPFWHTKEFDVSKCTMDETVRAPIWYCEDGIISDCKINSVKCLRECRKMTLSNCNIVSTEFGWRCDRLEIENCDIQSEYFLFECKRVRIEDLHLTGKYSFQYTKDMTIYNSMLETKDAFWHSENVTVRNCTVKGEYLGWYSKGLTLENCKIIGTQPFCYCENLTLVNCTMEDADLAFEYSDVMADVKGHIISVKNPHKGCIVADSIGETILENSVMETDCKILLRQNAKCQA